MNYIFQVTIFDVNNSGCPVELIDQAWFSSKSSALDYAEPCLIPDLLVKIQCIPEHDFGGCVL